MDVPGLDSIHYIKIAVTDQSRRWHTSRLGTN